VYLIGDELVGETTELETRIAHENRRTQNDDSLSVKIEFMGGLTDRESVTLFELLPLLRAVRETVTSSRPLAADDLQLPSETTSDSAEDPNPKGYDVDELKRRIETALEAFANAVGALRLAMPPRDAEGNPNLALADHSSNC
jgi:hypothetical protein